MMRYAIPVALLLLLAADARAAVRTQAVEYKDGGTVLEGFLAYDDAISGRRPGVVVVPEWMGLNDYAKRRAEQLAGLGYVAFAIDMYGKGVRPKDDKEAAALAGKYRGDRKLMRERAAAGLEVLRSDPMTDPRRIAAVGYCFGGTVVLELARSGAPLAGVVSFHGGLDTPNPEDARRIKGKVLALHGADDPFAPAAQRAAFEDEMRKGGVDWQVVVYGGAVHGFTNPDNGTDKSKGLAYDATADRRSWQAMKDFFAEIFK